MRLKVNKAEQRLEEAMKVTQEVETKRTEAETEIQSAERDTRMLSRRKDDLETEVRELHSQRDIVQKTLESLQVNSSQESCLIQSGQSLLGGVVRSPRRNRGSVTTQIQSRPSRGELQNSTAGAINPRAKFTDQKC